MSGFYLLPGNLLTVCLVILAIAVLVETAFLIHSFRSLKFNVDNKSNWRSNWIKRLFEAVILAQLIVMTLMLADADSHIRYGLVQPGGYIAMRYCLFGVLAVLSFAILALNHVSHVKHENNRHVFDSIAVSLAVFATLPVMEIFTKNLSSGQAGSVFPVLFMAVIVFWLVRCTRCLRQRCREEKNFLSDSSVKEAIDALDSGLLFYHPRNGQILLQNRRIQELMFILTGQRQYNGAKFYQALQIGKVLPNCQKEEMGFKVSYRLPDNSIWVFHTYEIKAGQQEWTLLTASDTTERWNAAHQLWQQNRELEERNHDLTLMLENLESICETEEIIQAKSRVHDILGQRVSLLLRAMREHRKPDGELLEFFVNGLPKELLTESGSGQFGQNFHSLDTLARVFHGLGVDIQVTGNLPDDKATAQTFYEIAMEAVTNSVRHGYASRISIESFQEQDIWKMKITDNGMISNNAISEGGGLRGMRRKILELGGTFAYSCTPHFRIFVAVPTGPMRNRA